MLENEVIVLGESLMGQWGLIDLGWKFGIDRKPSIRRLGCCEFGAKRIGISLWYLELNEADLVTDTIKHEIAHALAFIRYGETGHGRPWIRMCAEVGCRPRRFKENVSSPPPQFAATCPACSKLFTRHTKLKRGRISWCNCQSSLPPEDRKYLIYSANPLFVKHSVQRVEKRLAADSNTGTVSEISNLLTQLSMTTDKNTAKRIRAKLRKMGHRGGLH